MAYIESADSIVAHARKRGWKFNRPQLAAMHRADMIDRPVQLARRQRRGTESFYVSGTALNLTSLLTFRKTNHLPLADWAWLALTQGHPFPSSYWVSRLSEANASIAQVGRWLRLDRDPDDGTPCLSDDAPGRIRRICKRRSRNAIEGEIRRRLGKKRFPEFLDMLIGAAFGAYQPAESFAAYDQQEEQRILRIIGRGFGISPPEKKKFRATNEDNLWSVRACELDTMLSRISAQIAVPVPEQSSKEREREAQSAAVELLAIILRLASVELVQRQISGKSSPALALLSRTIAHLSEKSFFVWVSLWMKIRRIPQIGNAAREFLACEPDFSNSLCPELV